MSKNFYHYPVWVRLWHVTNAVLCLFLIVTGFSMLYSNPANDLVVGFKRAVSMHNICGVLLTLSYTFFLFGNLFTSNGKHYLIALKGLGQRLYKQAYYYIYGYFVGEKAPFPITGDRKFNPLQQISYDAVMYFVIPLLFITGWALLFPDFILKKFLGFSGIFLTDQLHVVMGFLVVIFLFIHLYVSTMGKSPVSNFRSIVTGWHESH
ncbi:MAG: cytochrome b/b6 domain-containing protein [Bacteroidales bacterium]|nr:cytochrome b/b6 domain-containing protein [Bacteroidales bacterium]